MVGVVPLGTGNDLARVLGWGSQCNDEEKIPVLLTDMEKSSFKLLDRWSVQYTTEEDIDLSCLRSTSVSYGLGISKKGERSSTSSWGGEREWRKREGGK